MARRRLSGGAALLNAALSSDEEEEAPKAPKVSKANRRRSGGRRATNTLTSDLESRPISLRKDYWAVQNMSIAIARFYCILCSN